MHIQQLITETQKLRVVDRKRAATMVAQEPTDSAIEMLSHLNNLTRYEIVQLLPAAKKAEIYEALDSDLRDQWRNDGKYKKDTVGSLLQIVNEVFGPEETVAHAVERMRELSQKYLINYGFITDEQNHLKGVFAFRELLFAEPETKLKDIAVLDPFYLTDDMPLDKAMLETTTRHFPAYPVCNNQGELVGVVRGHVLFEQQAFEISAMPGKMQGVDKEERLSTPLVRSLKFRNPWLLLNLATAFIAAAVVGIFQDTLDQIIVLAAFLPVLAGQSGNTGCQALAVTLRGMTLGEMKPNTGFKLVVKESMLGFTNGAIVGVIAAAGMWYYASSQGNEGAMMLAAIVWVAMTVACIVSGVAGSIIPLILKKVGADPATASSIFLTTMTDVVSMGVFLGLASFTL